MEQDDAVEVERVYREFWARALEKGGVFDVEQAKKELFDYHFLLKQVPEIYMHITGGLLSKTNYRASTVIEMADDHLNKLVDEETKELEAEIRRLETGQELGEEL